MSDQYAFDATEFEVEFNAKPTAAVPVLVAHKLRRPTLAELVEREKQSAYEMVEVSPREDELRVDDEAANCRLWDKLIMGVRGYDGNAEWRPLTDEDKARMRAGHKSTAIKGLYLGECAIEDDGTGISFAEQTWTVKQSIAGVYEIRHTLREPNEAERARFRRTASSTRNVRGSKQTRVAVVGNLNAYVELFDALWQGCTGAQVGGQPFEAARRGEFLASIDPIWKRQVVSTLTAALEAQLQD